MRTFEHQPQHAYRIGEPFFSDGPADVNQLNGLHLSFGPSGAEILMCVPDLRPDEIEQMCGGTRVRFWWADLDHTGFLVAQFGRIWADGSYTPHLDPGLTWPEVGKPALAYQQDTNTIRSLIYTGNHFPATIFAVDARNGILKGMRFVSWSPSFARKVRTSVQRLAGTPFNRNWYQQTYIPLLMARYPHSQAVAEIADTTCLGGSFGDSTD